MLYASSPKERRVLLFFFAFFFEGPFFASFSSGRSLSTIFLLGREALKPPLEEEKDRLGVGTLDLLTGSFFPAVELATGLVALGAVKSGNGPRPLSIE